MRVVLLHLWKGVMAETEIYILTLFACNCYLIKEEGTILVDVGALNQGKKLLKSLAEISVDPRDISLILLTHGHYEHIGLSNEIKNLTDGKIAINKREKEWVEQALKPFPPGVNAWGKILEMIGSTMLAFIRFPGTPVDLVLEDEVFSLESYGIQGRVFHTPGHSSGSMSLLLDTGDAFIGDLSMNSLPWRIGPGMPIFADDVNTVRDSWRLLLSSGAQRIYPAHGKPFPADVLRKSL